MGRGLRMLAFEKSPKFSVAKIRDMLEVLFLLQKLEIKIQKLEHDKNIEVPGDVILMVEKFENISKTIRRLEFKELASLLHRHFDTKEGTGPYELETYWNKVK